MIQQQIKETGTILGAHSSLTNGTGSFSLSQLKANMAESNKKFLQEIQMQSQNLDQQKNLTRKLEEISAGSNFSGSKNSSSISETEKSTTLQNLLANNQAAAEKLGLSINFDGAKVNGSKTGGSGQIFTGGKIGGGSGEAGKFDSSAMSSNVKSK